MKNTYSDKLTIYLDEPTKKLIPKAKEIFRREHSSISEWFRTTLSEYVRLHSDGNPQQRIDVILFNKAAYYAPKFCGVRGCNGQASGFGMYQGKRYVLCRAHINVFADSKAWKIE